MFKSKSMKLLYDRSLLVNYQFNKGSYLFSFQNTVIIFNKADNNTKVALPQGEYQI